jgi:hypothetical protein
MIMAGRPSEKGRTARNTRLAFHVVYLGVGFLQDIYRCADERFILALGVRSCLPSLQSDHR